MKPDGGPAFPVQNFDAFNGMTLRDYFAAQCLMGMCCTMEMVAKMDAPERAKYAYLNADAMLAERAK